MKTVKAKQNVHQIKQDSRSWRPYCRFSNKRVSIGYYKELIFTEDRTLPQIATYW